MEHIESNIESSGTTAHELRDDVPDSGAPSLKTNPKALQVNDRAAIVVHDNSELLRLIKIMMVGKAFPETLDTEAKVIAAWQVAASLRLPPAVAIQNMALIKGVVCIWGQLPKALAEATGEMENFRLTLIDQEQNQICLANKNLHQDVWAAVVHVKRKGRTENEYTFSELDARKAGLWGKSGPWSGHTKIMLARRAMGQAMKFEFPDALMGVPVAEYDLDTAPDLKDVSHSSSDKPKGDDAEALAVLNGGSN